MELNLHLDELLEALLFGVGEVFMKSVKAHT